MKTVIQVLQRIPPDVMANVEEIVLFDDASQDHTFEMALGYKVLQGMDKLTVLRNGRNLGYGGNQKAGYRYFMDRGLDAVVLLHGDGQYAPELLASLYGPIVTGKADAVFGSRMMTEYGGALKGRMPLYKLAGNRILTWHENRALGMRLTEFHSGYRAYSLAALREIKLDRMTDGFHFDTEIIIKLHHQHFRIMETPIPTYYGSEISYVNGFRYAWDVFRAIRRYRRTVESLATHPEFEEYFVRYGLKRTPHSSHMYLLQMLGTGKSALDVGCGDGALASLLIENGNRVTGVDALPQADMLPAGAYIRADLDRGLRDIKDQLRSQGPRFDTIVLADILEHLRDPGHLLDDCRAYLKRGGSLLVSVPNVANIVVRASLLAGRFDYADRGILDRSHLRFFTRRTLRALLRAHGYRILRERTSVIPLDLALGVRPGSPFLHLLFQLLHALTWAWPTLFGYQFILEVADAQAGSDAVSSSASD